MKAGGIRNSRWSARISRGSNTPAYAVQRWNSAEATAYPPRSQPSGPPRLRSASSSRLDQARLLVRPGCPGVERNVGEPGGILGGEILESGMDLPHLLEVGQQHFGEAVDDIFGDFDVGHDGVGHG